MAEACFDPIAIIGRGCVLPGALTPRALWQAVLEDRDLLSPAPPGKWGVTDTEQQAMPYRGGFVTGFETVFDPAAYDLRTINPARLDPLFQWLLHAGREAWLEAGSPHVKRKKLGVIAGNLGYPSRALCDFAGDIWETGQSGVPPYNRFNTGGPARLLARALGAKGPAFALDAACASSLYAVKLACDRLQDGSIDIAMAAAVNGADNLILHQGFSALNALSPTGRSRPFVKGADGLVPAEGAAAIVLKRLSDCTSADTVYGVIRGIGLSNDGRRKSLLAPDEGGQAEAMAAAWAMADLDPSRDIGLIEAHATGTPTGDKVELTATAAHFAGMDALPIGSLKGNLGHLITAAGMASLIKMSFALNEGVIPPTRLEGDVLDGFAGSNMVPARRAIWPDGRPRIAAISNFGFGGNNAHLILSADDGTRPKAGKRKKLKPEAVICATGLSMGPDRGVAAVLQRLSRPPKQPRGAMSAIAAQPKRLRTPPSELGAAQGQQLALYDAVDEALTRHPLEDGARVGVFAGFSCSGEAARWMLRARIAKRLGLDPDSAQTDTVRNAVSPPLKAGDVLGAMPNVSANRINVRGDWRAQGFAVMAEEASGLRALDLAMRALETGEIDAAIVAACDLSADPVHEAATGRQGGDAAAALILKRSGDADGAAVKGVKVTGRQAEDTLLEHLYGHAHAAGGLARLAVETELAIRGHRLDEAGLSPDLHRASRGLEVTGGKLKLKAAPRPSPDMLRPAPIFETYAASDPQALAATLSAGRQGNRGEYRLAIVAADEAAAADRRAEAYAALKAGKTPSGDGTHYGSGGPSGALAFVFTGAAAAYTGMGQGLFAAFPELGPLMAAKFPAAADVARLLATDLAPAFDQLRATTLISQAQHLLLTELLGLTPGIAMGLSSGETNSLIAFGAWQDADQLMATIGESGMYARDLAGDFRIAQQAWQDDSPVNWETWRVQAPEASVRTALASEPRCGLTILYSPADAVIAGDAAACQRVLKALGGPAIRVPHDLVVHTPLMASYEETWHGLHLRKTKAPKGIRFYANALNSAYTPDAGLVADVLTGQAVAEVNFPKTLHQAYQDGVRTFIEIGPRDTLTGAIRETLGEDVRAVATDRFGQPALMDIAGVAATAFAAGHAADTDWLKARLDETRANAIPLRIAAPGEVTFPAHAPAPRLPERPHLRTLKVPDWTALKPFALAGPRPATGRKLPLAPGTNWRAPKPATTDTDLLEQPAKSPAPRRPAPKPVPGAKPKVRPLERREPAGPGFTRAELEKAAAGNISEVFGPQFAAQDKYRRQVRMPRPPLLLCDRITGIDAEALVQGKGTIWTETDVMEDHWAVSDGQLRPGPLIEAGQADLALISWMGADMLNCSDRVYRLLGCELTFHEGGLPRVGETIRFQISIKGHAELSGVRMFFFEYDGYADDRLVLSVRNGQAGFFTDEELANSRGVLWDAESEGAPTAEPVLATTSPSGRTSFSAADVAALRTGDTFRCFGAGFERAAPHTRPARLPSGRLALFDRVEAFEPHGGPWGRGYLKAYQSVPKDAWFYDGHFHEDPCMPGTLMAEAAVQALEFTAAAMGLTVERDSHVFEPVPGEAATFYCRGQVVPDADHDVTYEVFVDEIIDGEEPVVFASLLARSDGRKVFYCPRFGVRLRRAWPATKSTAQVPHYVNDGCDVRGDETAILECGSGAPSSAFGSMYAPFDSKGAVPRLPQPPYHMVSRVLSVNGPSARQQAGLTAIAEYDIPPDAWYFHDGGTGTMPFSVLTEVILQPCGWLASYSGFALSGETRFRNLDGKGVTARQVRPDDGTVRTRTTLTRCSRVGPMTIVFFELEATLADGTPVVTLETSFGFFTKASLASQAGLKAGDEARAFLEAPADPPSEAETLLQPSTERLALFDLIDRFEPEGGTAGLGRIRARQSVDPHAWYFRAHFFSDPVQPGSLGLDMLVQLLARAGDLKGLGEAFANPAWEPIAPAEALSWSYRGQVTPTAKQVTATVEIERVEERDDETVLTGTGSLWVDGLRIYEMRGVSVRFSERDGLPPARQRYATGPSFPAWIGAHRPTHTVPALPLLSQAGILLRQAWLASFDSYPIEINNFSPRQWADVPDEGLLAEASVTPDGAARLRGRNAAEPDTAFRLLSSGNILCRPRAPAPRLEPLSHGDPLPDPYETADLFHGPGLRPITRMRRDAKGFEAVADLALAHCPGNAFDPVILDALVHGPPHERPEEWFDGVEDCAIYPVRIDRLVICSDLPDSGNLTIRGVPGRRDPATGNLPVTIEAFLGQELWARLDLIEKAYPKGPLAVLNPRERRDFLTGARDTHPAPLSRWDGKRTLLSPADVIACDWLPGTVAAAWGCEGLTGTGLVKAVAVKEHFARKWKVHPGKIQLHPPFVIGPDGRHRYALEFDSKARAWAVSDDVYE